MTASPPAAAAGISCPATERSPLPSLTDAWFTIRNEQPMATRSLANCANLAVPASASTTLSLLLTNALHTINATKQRTVWASAGFAHHKHNVLPHHLYERGARCFVVTLRDPAARLETTLAWEWDSVRTARHLTRLAASTRSISCPDSQTLREVSCPPAFDCLHYSL